MDRFRLLVSATVVLLLRVTVLSPVAVVGAQEATPAARLGAPDPSECTVEPRPIDLLRAVHRRHAHAPSKKRPGPAWRKPPRMPSLPPCRRASRPMRPPSPPCSRPHPATRRLHQRRRLLGALCRALHRGLLPARVRAALGRFPRKSAPRSMAATPEPLPGRQPVPPCWPSSTCGCCPTAESPASSTSRIRLPTRPGRPASTGSSCEENGRWLIDEQIMFGPIDPEQIGTPTA